MGYPTSGCVNISQPADILTSTYQSSFSGTINGVGAAFFSLNNANFQLNALTDTSVSNLTLTTITDIPEVCTNYQNVGLITPTVISNQVYTVNNALITVTSSDFSYSITNCYDPIRWIYTASQADGSSLPSAVVFTQLSAGNGFKFEIYTTDNTLQGTYSIKVQGILTSLYTASTSFQVNILPDLTVTTTSSTSSTSSTSTTTSTTSTTSTTTTTTSTTSTTTSTTTSSTSSSTTQTSTSSSTQTTTPQSSTSAQSTTTQTSTTPAPTPSSTTQTTSTTSTTTLTSSTTSTPVPATTKALLANEAPYFKTNLQDIVICYAGQPLSVSLPQIIDPNLDQTYLSISNQLQKSGNLPSFITYTKSTLTLNPQSVNVGKANYIVKVFDRNPNGPLSTTYYLQIIVYSSQEYRDQQFQNQNPTTPLPTTTKSPSQTQDPNVDSNDVQINSIDSNGEVSITIGQDVTDALNTTTVNQTLFDIYTSSKDGDNKVQNWTVTTDSQGNTIIQVIFTDPDSISMFQDSDYLTITINSDKFQQIKVSQEIPPQFGTRVDGQVVLYTSSILYSMVSSVLYGSIGLGLIGGTSLQILWSLINTLQLITHTPLFSIPYTQRIFIFLKAFFSIATFDVINSSDILQVIFGLHSADDYPPYNSRFDFLGYNSCNFVYLIGPPMFYFFYFALMSLIYLVLFKSMSEYKWQKNIGDFIQKSLYFNGFLIYFLETWLEAGFSAAVNYINPQIDTAGDVVSIILASLFVLVNITFAIISPIYLLRYYRDYDQSFLRTYYSEIVTILRSQNKWSIFYRSSFILRRIIYIFFVLCLPRYLTFQLHIFILCNLAYLMFILGAKPIEENYYQEINNELATLALSYLMLVYNDFVPSIEAKKTTDTVFVVIFLSNVFINILIIARFFVLEFILKFKRLKRWLANKKSKVTANQQIQNQVKLYPLDKNNQKLKLNSNIRLDLSIINEEHNTFIDDENINNLSTRRGLKESGTIQSGFEKDFFQNIRNNFGIMQVSKVQIQNIEDNLRNQSRLKNELSERFDQSQRELLDSQYNIRSNSQMTAKKSSDLIGHQMKAALMKFQISNDNLKMPEYLDPNYQSSSQRLNSSILIKEGESGLNRQNDFLMMEEDSKESNSFVNTSNYLLDGDLNGINNSRNKPHLVQRFSSQAGFESQDSRNINRNIEIQDLYSIKETLNDNEDISIDKHHPKNYHSSQGLHLNLNLGFLNHHQQSLFGSSRNVTYQRNQTSLSRPDKYEIKVQNQNFSQTPNQTLKAMEQNNLIHKRRRSSVQEEQLNQSLTLLRAEVSRSLGRPEKASESSYKSNLHQSQMINQLQNANLTSYKSMSARGYAAESEQEYPQVTQFSVSSKQQCQEYEQEEDTTPASQKMMANPNRKLQSQNNFTNLFQKVQGTCIQRQSTTSAQFKSQFYNKGFDLREDN